jgi:hypothetical protein
VNSTSKHAWKAVLASMRGQTMPDGTSISGTVLTRFARSFKPGSGAVGAWNNYRELTDAEIDRLAAEVVKEVRDRGPFMSLADFVNRRLLDSADVTSVRMASKAPSRRPSISPGSTARRSGKPAAASRTAPSALRTPRATKFHRPERPRAAGASTSPTRTMTDPASTAS